MTMITQYPTKKALTKAVATHPEAVTIQDPALRESWKQYGKEFFTLSEMEVGDSFAVTNHSKRSWFAVVRRVSLSTWMVS